MAHEPVVAGVMGFLIAILVFVYYKPLSLARNGECGSRRPPNTNQCNRSHLLLTSTALIVLQMKESLGKYF